MSFVDDFNTDIELIKGTISDLFDRSKEQVLSLDEKSNSSFVELSSIFSRDSDLEDTFVDGSKIVATDGIVFDKDGWSNSFFVNEKKFQKEYYTKQTFPMSMAGGRVIPGSDFSSIFTDGRGFWGYMRDDQPVDSQFNLNLDVTDGVPEIDKLYLRTNTDLDVEAFYRSSFQGPWISLGVRSGQHHVWTQPFIAVEVYFKAFTSVFSVSLVQAAGATFGLTGTLTTTYHTVENLRMLTIEKDSETPTGTSIRTFVHVSNDRTQVPPGSGLIEWEGEKQVLLATTEYASPCYSGYIIPSGEIESSLVVRTGYRTWDTVSTTDYSIVTQSIDRLMSSYLDIPAGYRVISEGVKSVYIGTGDSRVEFSEGDDYTLQYDLNADTIQVMYVAGGRLPTIPEVQPTAEVLVKGPTSVTQRRTFVDLEIDRDITVTTPTAGLTIRTLHIGDTIENETTVESPDVGVYTFAGKKGLNLIEVESYNPSNPPQLLGAYDYFATRYRQRKSETTPPGANEFYLDPVAGGLSLVTSGTNLFVRYLVPTTYNNVSVRFEFDGKENVAPTLRSYRLINRIDRD